jgi:hypothetical protein
MVPVRGGVNKMKNFYTCHVLLVLCARAAFAQFIGQQPVSTHRITKTNLSEFVTAETSTLG